MSVSDENRSKFLDAINKYAEEQRNKIEAEVELFKEKELEKAETDILSEAYALIQKEMSNMRQRIASETSRKAMESRKKLFGKRREITDRVFKAVEEKLAAFTATEAYPAMLQKYAQTLSKVLPADGAVVTLRREDKPYADLVKKAFGEGCTVTFSDDIRLGGLRAYHQGMGRIADETLDSKLEEQREWFVENCGMTIQ